MSWSVAGTKTSGRNVPVWLDSFTLPDFPPLRRRMEADVCVVGAGIAGLTTAYLLRQQGRSVVVLEDGRVASGETGRTTAHLTAALDERWFRIEELHGEMGARLAAESHRAAIDRVESIVAEEQIDCGFARVDGYLFAARPDHVGALQRECEAARRAGLDDVAMVPRAPAGTWDTGPALRFPRQARLHPARYLAGLARAFVRAGGRIFCGTHAREIAGGSPARVSVQGDAGEVVAGSVVVATNAPVSDRFRLPTKQFAYRTYVVALKLRGAFGPQLLWDTDEPYHYVRTARGEHGEVLLVGGEDHRTGQADDMEERFERLEHWARARFPLRSDDPVYRWSGQVMEPVDGLAYIGRDPEDATGSTWVATGHSGNGTTYGTIAGMLFADALEGRRNRWSEVYDPSRHSLRAAARWAGENLGVVPEYAEWVTGGDVESAREVAPGSGAVVRRGLRKVAVYRDERGGAHERSAACPHLGCVVHWNESERSWDCPCHGSRFDATGTVINGPADADLPPA